MRSSTAKNWEEKLLDDEKIHHLIHLGKTKPNFMPQLVEAFAKCAVEIFAELKGRRADRQTVQHLGHRLAVLASNIGASKLERLAAAIESAGEEGRLMDVDGLIDQAEMAFFETRELLSVK